MKEKIIQILKDNAWEMEKDRYVIGTQNIANIAEEVVKLFYQPAVSSQVCQCMMPDVDSRDTFSTCHRCHLPARKTCY